MSEVTKVLSAAVGEIGTREQPPHSNNVKYNTAFYGKEMSGNAFAWCCAFQWWVFHQVGLPELFFGGKRTASCTVLYQYYRKQGQTIPAAEAQPGDLVFFVFDSNTNGTMNHIGICESCTDGYVTTIDGNTSVDNDANGGCVMRRKRALKYVGGVARPNYEEKIDLTTEEVHKLVEAAIDAAVLKAAPKVYTSLTEVPKWAQGLVGRALKAPRPKDPTKTMLQGDVAGKFNLTDSDLITLQLFDNAGLLG